MELNCAGTFDIAAADIYSICCSAEGHLTDSVTIEVQNPAALYIQSCSCVGVDCITGVTHSGSGIFHGTCLNSQSALILDGCVIITIGGVSITDVLVAELAVLFLTAIGNG